MEFWIRGASVGFGGMAYLMTLIDTEKAVQVGTAAVSYTHLTLPTILLV